jgi:type IV secretion system protein VirB4
MTNYLGNERPNPQEMLIDDAAQALVSDLGTCLREMEVNGNHFGQFSMTLVLYAKDRLQTVETAVAEAFKVFSTYDAVLLEERYNVLNAFLATIPGNWAYNLRYMHLLNTNYADLAFLFTLHTGEPENRHLGAEYLAVLETNHGTPYFLNLHYQDRAHTIMLGATGAGKSFFLNFLLTNLQKYQPYTFIFDLGGSYQDLTAFFNGSYVRVGVEQRAFEINPFCLEPTKENLHFLFSFVKVLIETGGGYTLTNPEQKDLYEQIENLYQIDRDQRRLFTLSNILPRHIGQHLARWVAGGQYAALFDNVQDTLSFARFQAFDFEGLDKYPQVLEPLLFYVLHRANASIYAPELATTFKAFVMDEAWRFLRNATIKEYITEALKTWRKRNAALIMATQSSDDLSKSDILRVIVESCATTIFLANPGMDQALYRDIFHLNETESQLIAELIPKKQALIKRPDMARVVNLNVDDTGYWLYTNSPFDNQRKREAIRQYGLKRGLQVLAASRKASL